MNISSLSQYFQDSVASLPALDNLVIPKVSLQQFTSLDARISDPRLLSQNSKMRVTGEPFSQSTYGSYLIGLAVVPRLDIKLTDGTEDLKSAYFAQAKKELISLLNYSNVNGVRGNRSVIVGSLEEFYDNEETEEYQMLPFAISTSVFYNERRVTIGFGNTQDEVETIKKNLEQKNKFFDDFVILDAKDSNELDELEELGIALASKVSGLDVFVAATPKDVSRW